MKAVEESSFFVLSPVLNPSAPIRFLKALQVGIINLTRWHRQQ
jgi:hypothetical protein